VGSFSNGNDENPAIRIQVVQIFADAQNAMIAMNVTRKRSTDGRFS
jgi:hypothetical protein